MFQEGHHGLRAASRILIRAEQRLSDEVGEPV